jgi:hypothetical protein
MDESGAINGVLPRMSEMLGFSGGRGRIGKESVGSKSVSGSSRRMNGGNVISIWTLVASALPLFVRNRSKEKNVPRSVLPQSKQELAFVRVSGNTLAEEHP